MLDRGANYEKIVERRRGGWCFELNGLFAWLLEQLGYRVTLLGSRVDGERGAGWELAHLLLRVDLDRPYLVDVGFGEGSLEPVPLEQVADGVMRHQQRAERRVHHQPAAAGGVPGHVRLPADLTGVRVREDPDSAPWRCRTVALRLRELVLTERHGDQVSERELAGEEEWRDCLLERFGVAL